MNTALWVLFYIIETLPIFVIARKCEDANAWMAFVPVANLWLLCNMADFEAGFLLVWLVPYVNILFLGIIWWRIAENTNKSGWIGLLMVIPVVNLFVGYYIAFVDTGELVA